MKEKNFKSRVGKRYEKSKKLGQKEKENSCTKNEKYREINRERKKDTNK